jgi:AcrR family transcriptional regulator
MSVAAIRVVMTAAAVNAGLTELPSGAVSRWEPDAQGRLTQAAMDLYAERGFERTTVAEIAQRAGLTERTFFRHFTDKREVLFHGAGALKDLLVGEVERAPASMPPIEMVASALVQAAATFFEERRDFAVRRQAIIAANVELQERELVKMATLAAELAGALRRHGVADPAASLAGEAGIAVLKIAFQRWVDDTGERTLAQLIRDSLEELRATTAGVAPAPAG